MAKQKSDIVQIIPATGWEAVLLGMTTAGEPRPFTMPLVCWALREEQDTDGSVWRHVVGLILDSDRSLVMEAEALEHLGYKRSDEELGETWLTKAQEEFERSEKLRDLLHARHPGATYMHFGKRLRNDRRSF